jgi:membrane protein implicated in regulation of membrane protease activity
MPFIYIIHSRWIRFWLHCEEAAAPVGYGVSFGFFANVFVMSFLGITPRHWYVLIAGSAAIILLLYNMWRPVHRRLGLRHDSVWSGP